MHFLTKETADPIRQYVNKGLLNHVSYCFSRLPIMTEPETNQGNHDIIL